MDKKRQVFFSFEYKKDCWRTSQIRNMNLVNKDSTFSDNDWEEVKYSDDKTIKNWIDDQMQMRSCIVVLIGETTSTRKWVKYEIEQAYKLNKGIVGIYIHKLKNQKGEQCEKGANPFYHIFTDTGERLSKFICCYDSQYKDSADVYNDIANNFNELVEYALVNKAP